MLLTLSTTHRPATDLGYLLMKNPANVHSVELPFGRAILFFPEANEARCTAAILLEVDAIDLVRGRGAIEDQYVNDRPYAASSLLSVALGRLVKTAMAGRSRDRQALADTPIPLEAALTPLPARGGAGLVERLFGPLGYTVEATPIPLDPAHPEWGDSPYVDARLTGTVRLSALLTHLTVLIPVLDDSKHYYLGEEEVEKLLSRGEGWLDTHPERELIIGRYLRFGSLKKLARAALDGNDDVDCTGDGAARPEGPDRLNDQRMKRVAAVIGELGATSVLDLGCGEGRLLRDLIRRPGLTRLVGVEVAPRVLATAADRLRLETMPDAQRQRVELMQGSLVYRDDRLVGFDVAVLVEVIEHMEPERLPAMEAAVFGHARPAAVLVTTPNREHNALYLGMADGASRHTDHRFEWSRAEFENWAAGVADAHGYDVRFEGIGTLDPEHGAPTQMAVFTRSAETGRKAA